MVKPEFEDIYVFFDFETTTGKDIDMQVYMVSYYICYDIKEQDYDFIKDNTKTLFIGIDGINTEKQLIFSFFKIIEDLVLGNQNIKVKMYAWNSSKFDSIFLSRHMFHYFNKCHIAIYGNQNNLKLI